MKSLLLFFSCLFADSFEENFISKKTFASIPDHLVTLIHELDATSIQQDEIVFLQSSLYTFFTQIHPQISCRYTLLSHSYGFELPGKWEKMLDDPKIKGWFAQNIVESNHPKLYPIPLGVPTEAHKAKELLQHIEQAPHFFDSKPVLLYANFSICTHLKERKPLWEKFSKEPYCLAKKNLSYSEYLDDLTKSYFVLAPRGVNLDSFRTWEALYMGAIPIVKSSSLNPVYEELPVLIVDTWDEINEDFLRNKLELFKKTTYNLAKLKPEYWINFIKNH